MARFIDATAGLFGRIPQSFIALMGRLSIAWLFWLDGRARVGGSWNILEPRGPTMAMFAGGYNIPYVPAALAATALQVAEFILPLLLAFGLATRLAALGILVIIIVFEVFVHWGPFATHGAWAAVLLMIIKYGPGAVSLDEVVGRR